MPRRTTRRDEITHSATPAPSLFSVMGRFLLILIAVAGAFLGLLTLHSTVSHSHQGISGEHDHVVSQAVTLTAPDEESPAGAAGLLANCEGCALGTVTPSAGAALLLLMLVVVIGLHKPGWFARLMERGQRVIAPPSAAIPWTMTLPPLALGISRT